MRITKVDYNLPMELYIDGTRYTCDFNITGTDHVFNNAGSSMSFTKVYPYDWSKSELFSKTFEIKPYSNIRVMFGDTVFFLGTVINQGDTNFNPNEPNWLSIEAASLKEWLTHGFGDFAILSDTPESFVTKVVEAINDPRIKVGTLNFTNQENIQAYSTANETPYDSLRMVERLTSSLFEVLPTDDGEGITINFFNPNSIINQGVDINFTTNEEKNIFWKTYNVTKFTRSANTSKTSNKNRVESENVVSNTLNPVEFDLSTGNTSFNLEFKVATIIESTAELRSNIDGSYVGKLIIATADQASDGKSADISYTVNSNTITIENENIVDSNNTVVFEYRSISRQKIDFEDQSSQTDIANRVGNTGVVTRYEKMNNLAEFNDIVKYGNYLTTIGVSNKNILYIESMLPIWEIGQSTNFITGDGRQWEDSYIVQSLEIVFKETGSRNKTYRVFRYTLTASLDLENDANFYDPQIYRDNPVVAEEAITDKSENFEQIVYVVSRDYEQDCADVLGTIDSLEGELEYSLDDQSLDNAKYPIIIWNGGQNVN